MKCDLSTEETHMPLVLKQRQYTYITVQKLGEKLTKTAHETKHTHTHT